MSEKVSEREEESKADNLKVEREEIEGDNPARKAEAKLPETGEEDEEE
jgi:hypothetical protein